jgi:DNA-directed RNA polymerase subunit beta'
MKHNNKKSIVYKYIYYKPLEIKLSLLSHQKILNKSSGEVKSPNTIGYNTIEPEEGGLFCNKIFRGNSRYNYICTTCASRQTNPYRCRLCGSNTRLDKSNAQNLSIGHVNLISPVPHPWFVKTKIIHCLYAGTNNIFDYKEIHKIIEINPEAVYLSFKKMDLLETYYILRCNLLNMLVFSLKRIKLSNINNIRNRNIDLLTQKIKLISSFIRLKQRPEWVFLKVVPVLSPTYRPLRRLSSNVFIASDINYLYQHVIERNNSFKKLLDRHLFRIENVNVHPGSNVQDIKNNNPIIRAKINLQRAVIELLDASNAHDSGSTNIKSVVNRLSGKEGRFRKDILGKRINFSGRTVITSGPKLKVNQCGLPVELVLELFKPFIQLKIRELPFFHAIASREAIMMKQLLLFINNEVKIKSIYRLVNDFIGKHPILLNRAPTLHKFNIQAFSPLLIHTKSIQLHPLVCSSFNADFDGDTMAVYVPHTIRSQIEARLLMMTSANIITPSTNDPIVTPSQDVVFGLYYITVMFNNAIGEGRTYNNIMSVKESLDSKILDIHAPIFYIESMQGTKKKTLTSPGRLLMYQLIKEFTSLINIEDVNKVLDKKEIMRLVKYLYNTMGNYRTSHLLDQLMSMGFYYAYKAGISLHTNDINVPNLKHLFVQRTSGRMDLLERQQTRNKLSKDEASKRLLNEWSKCAAMITNQIFKDILHTIPMYKSTIYMLIHSGARGSMIQMRQLSGIRGLMIKPSGDILEVPIVSNFKEGLNSMDYFNSTHGARKGVIDTSLKTATSGYLTRKLFYASKDVFIVENDCYTQKGVLFGDIKHPISLSISLHKDLFGRYTLYDIKDPYTGNIILEKEELIREDVINSIVKLGIEHVLVRSPITCESRHGVCKKCYGLGDREKAVSLGDSVGIIAAQSIGEPGTQLTMRTFHQGGTVLKGGSDHIIYSVYNGRILITNQIISTINVNGNIKYINISRDSQLLITDESSGVLIVYPLPYGCRLYIRDGEFVYKNMLLFDWDPYSIPIISNEQGYIKYKKKVIDSLCEERSYLSGHTLIYPNSIFTAKKWGLITKHTMLENMFMPQDTLYILNNTLIKKGHIIGKISATQGITQDITGGLSKISKLFECVETNTSIIAPVDGYIVLNNDSTTSKIRVYIKTRDKRNHIWRITHVANAQHDTTFYVRNNDYVYRGDILSDGILPIRDIAEKVGFQHSFYSLIGQILSTYMENGVNISQKHIEIIASQMFSKVANLYENKRYILGDSRRNNKKNNRKYNRKNNKNATVIVKTKTVRYPKDVYHSYIISQLAMGMPYNKGNSSLSSISETTFLSASFLSSASFQKTSKVLTEASIWKGYDSLVGAQGNLFFGYLVPLGTGSIRRIKDPYIANMNKVSIL